MFSIYLDHNATTPISSKAKEALLQMVEDFFANPSSSHPLGQKARQKLAIARTNIATLYGLKPKEVLFTSSGSEAINLMIRSFATLFPMKKIIASPIDHPAMTETLNDLVKRGYKVLFLPPTVEELFPLREVESLLSEGDLLAIGGANSETGDLMAIEELAFIAMQRKSHLFIDAIALGGKHKLPLFPGVTALALSAHKFHGPKGCGILLCRSPRLLLSQITGGGQEFGLRGGTENLPAIVASAVALEEAERMMEERGARMGALRDRFEAEMMALPLCIECNRKGDRVANTSNLYIPNKDGESLLIELGRRGIYASLGSACKSGALEPSKTLRAMGYSYERALSSLRFSFSYLNQEEEVIAVVEAMKEILT